MKRCTKHTDNKALGEYPGAAIDAADRDKVDSALVKERTETLNNNPRDTDDEMPG